MSGEEMSWTRKVEVRFTELELEMKDVQRALVKLIGDAVADADEPTNAVYFGGDDYPVQRLVLTRETPDVNGGHLLTLRHEVLADDAWVVESPVARHYSLGIDPAPEV